VIRKSNVWRAAPSLAGLLVYLAFALLWLAAPHLYAQVLWVADAMPQTPRPFNDFEAVLQAGACWRAGVNVYGPSACMHGGIFNYSPLLLHLPVGPQDTVAGAVALGVGFLLALAALPVAASRAELLMRVGAACSGTVIFALERGNLDVAIFLATLLGVALLRVNRWAALLGYGVFGLAAACKFYPAVLLGLMVRERGAQILAAAVAVVALGVLFGAHFAQAMAAAMRVMPVGLPFRGIFGAADIPFGLALLRYMPALTLYPNAAQYLAGVYHPNAVDMMQLATRILTIAGLVVGIKTAPVYKKTFRSLDEEKSLLLTAGAMVMVFCFYMAQNIPYRAIFLLLTLPGLWAMAGQRRVGWLLGAVFILLWEDFLRNMVTVGANWALPPAWAFYPEFGFFLFSEILWWWVVIQLTGLIVCFFGASLFKVHAGAAHGGEAGV